MASLFRYLGFNVDYNVLIGDSIICLLKKLEKEFSARSYFWFFRFAIVLSNPLLRLYVGDQLTSFLIFEASRTR